MISVRMMMTEPKTALAGGILEIFMRFKASMAAFNAEIAPSRSLGRWDSASMVETRSSHERTLRYQCVRKVPNPNRGERQSCSTTPRFTDRWRNDASLFPSFFRSGFEVRPFKLLLVAPSEVHSLGNSRVNLVANVCKRSIGNEPRSLLHLSPETDVGRWLASITL